MAKFSNTISISLLILSSMLWIDISTTRLFAGEQHNHLSRLSSVGNARILQTSDYGNPSQDPDVQKYCKDEDINPDDLVLKDQDRVNQYSDVSGRYSGITDDLIETLKTGGFNNGFSGKGSNIVTKAPIIIISIPLIIYLLRTWSRILIHKNRIFFCAIKILWFHYPSI